MNKQDQRRLFKEAFDSFLMEQEARGKDSAEVMAMFTITFHDTLYQLSANQNIHYYTELVKYATDSIFKKN